MLDPAGWLKQAQALPLGASERTDHDCGSGRTLKVDHKARGWGAWCWRCGEKGWVPKPPESFAERLSRMRAAATLEEEARRSTAPPSPKEHDPAQWPPEARLWLFKAGMNLSEIRRLGIYYCPPMKRVVIPVFDQGQVVYWQARTFDPDRPKYLNPQVDRARLVARFSVPAGPHDRQNIFDRRTLVLTEDYLSAWKVSRSFPAWSLLGTSFPSGLLPEIMSDSPAIAVWLDPDEAGEKGGNKITRQLRAYGLSVVKLPPSRLDPKLMSQAEIIDHVTTGLRSINVT